MSTARPARAPGLGRPEHWHSDDQFDRQLGGPAEAAIIAHRWSVFAAAISGVASRHRGRHILRILDAGCGDGINLVGLRRGLEALQVPWSLFAVDMNPLRVARARVSARADDRIAVASVSALPFPTGTFDVVLCNHVLEHVPDPECVSQEIARVLQPSGIAIVGVPNEGCVLAQIRNHVLQRSIIQATDHVNFFTRHSLIRTLAVGGLDVQQMHTEGFFLPHLRLLGIARATALGRIGLELARRALPSQAAGLIAVAARGDAAR